MTHLDPITITIIALCLCALFFIPEFVENKINTSFLAGLFITYLFLVMIPEIVEGFPEFVYQFSISMLLIIGFAFAYLSEIFILRNVDAKAQKHMKELIEDNKALDEVETGLENILAVELTKESLNERAIKEVTLKYQKLSNDKEIINEKLNGFKQKIQIDISTTLAKFRFIIYFIYHILVGYVLVELLIHDFITGILFFVFAWLIGFILERREPRQVFSDLNIYEIEIHEHKLKKYLMGSAALIGAIPALIIFYFFTPSILLLYILFAIIGGIMIFFVTREIIPNREKANPYYFLIGIIVFTAVVLITDYIGHLLG